jgi:hypothetical protein
MLCGRKRDGSISITNLLRRFKMRKMLFGLTAVLFAAMVFTGCADSNSGGGIPTLELPPGSYPTAAINYFAGYSPESARSAAVYGLDERAAWGGTVIFNNVTQSDAGTIVIPAGKGVQIKGTFTVNAGGTLVVSDVNSLNVADPTASISATGATIVAPQAVLDSAPITGSPTTVPAVPTPSGAATKITASSAIVGDLVIATAAPTSGYWTDGSLSGQTIYVVGNVDIQADVTAVAFTNLTVTGKVTVNAPVATPTVATVASLVAGNVNIAAGKGLTVAGTLTLVPDGTLTVNGTLATATPIALAGTGAYTVTGTGEITLTGAGSLFTVASGTTLDITDVTLTGFATNTAPAITVDGGALNLKGAAKVTGNSRTITTADQTYGSGILIKETGGTLHLADTSEVSGNTLVSGASATDTYLYGAGIAARSGTVTVDSGAFVKDNSITGDASQTAPHGYGAGIYIRKSNLTMNGTLSGNKIEFLAPNGNTDKKAYGAALVVYDADSNSETQHSISIGGTIPGNTAAADYGYYPVNGIYFMKGYATVTLTSTAVIGADQEIYLQAIGENPAMTSVLKAPHNWANTGVTGTVKLLVGNFDSPHNDTQIAEIATQNLVLVTKADTALDTTDAAKFAYHACLAQQGFYYPSAGSATTAYHLVVDGNGNLKVASN